MHSERGKYGKISGTLLLLAATLGISISGCKKIEPERLIIVKTGSVSEITRNSCRVTATLFDVGGAEGVSQHGFCWALSPDLADVSDQVDLGGKREKGDYDAIIPGLAPGTRYYIWAFATGGGKTVYGDPQTFDTQLVTAPGVETATVTNITFNSAISGGNVVDDGGSEITMRGICWNVQPGPTLDHPHTEEGSGTGEFESLITGLEPSTVYYVRAYATNSTGTGYGNEQSFETPSEPVAPELVTYTVSNIEYTAASCGGEIISDGGSPIISKGLCWSTDPNPTLSDASIEYGNGPDPFTMEISGLTHDTEYYVRAYATNSAGKTGYGNQQIFATPFQCGAQLLDRRDGQTYNTLSIGEQCWMGENLNYGKYIQSTFPQSDNETIEKYCYENNMDACATYGGLYTWDEMMQYTSIEMSRGVCPDGWHLPSDLEWKQMEMKLGMSVAEADATDWRGTDEGGKLKDKDTRFWNPPNTGATNESQFTALPSGMAWNDGSFSGIGDFAVFWTSTTFADDKTYAWYRYLHTDESRILRVVGYKQNTTPVRCVKD